MIMGKQIEQIEQKGNNVVVEVFPWAGELPYFHIMVGACRFFFQGASNKSITVYSRLQAVDASPPLDRPWQDWSIIVTNGNESLFIFENAGEVLIELRNTSDLLVTLNVEVEVAREISRRLIESLENHCNAFVNPDPHGTLVKPSGLYHTYKCVKTRYDFS